MRTQRAHHYPGRQSRRRSSPGGRQQRPSPRLRRPGLEMLEPRLLLSAAAARGAVPHQLHELAPWQMEAEIRGSKFNDLDGDATWDAGEPGLEGWTIYLDENRNRRRDDGEPVTRTGPDGDYAFTGLRPRTYLVAEEVQQGWQQTFPRAAPGPEFQVNTYARGGQWRPAMAIDPAGNFVIVWESDGQDGDGWGVYAQRYHADGTPQGEEFRVNTNTARDQAMPTVARAAAGNFVVAWASQGQDGDDWGIYAQMYDAEGTPQGSEFQVNTSTADPQWGPSVALGPDGNFVVAWTGPGTLDPPAQCIYAQMFHADGTRDGREFQASSSTDGPRYAPSVAIRPFGGGLEQTATDGRAGEFVIAWGGRDFGICQFDKIFARIFHADGTPQGREFQADTLPYQMDYTPSVALDAAGNFVVVWNSDDMTDGPGYADVRARMYLADGTPRGLDSQVNSNRLCASYGSSLALDAAGNFVVAWTGEIWGDGNRQDVYARMLLADGTPAGEEFIVNTNTLGDQWDPAVAIGHAGSFVTTWTNGRDGQDIDIFARQLVGFGLERAHRVVLGPGEVAEGIDFGNFQFGQIRGGKWHDLDGDAAWDDGEPGLEDWTIYLDLDDDGRLDPPGPGFDRHIEPDDFVSGPIVDPAGFATLRESLGGGSVVAAPSLLGPPSTPERVFGWVDDQGREMADWSEETATLEVAFAEPVSVVSLDFIGPWRGYHQGRLRIFDTSGALLQERLTELILGTHSQTLSVARPTDEIARIEATGLAAWCPPMLDRLEFSRQADWGEPSTATDADGQYEFTGLAPGTYTVAEVLPEGWRQTFPGPDGRLIDPRSRQLAQGGALDFHLHEVDATAAAEDKLEADITLEVLWSSTNYHLLPEATTYCVVDNDVVIELYAAVEEIGLPVELPEYETVSIASLDPGTYCLVATLYEPAGPDLPAFFASWEAAGTMRLRSAGSHSVTLQSGEIVEGLDFGNRLAGQEAEIRGGKFHDLDGDAAREEGEPGLEGWTIYLDRDDDGRLDPPEPGFSGEIDPWAGFPPGPIIDPTGFVTLHESLGGGPVFAVPPVWDPPPISERVFGWANEAGEENATWSEKNSVLEIGFAEPVSLVSLDFLAIGVWGCHQGRLQAFDASGALLEERLTELLCGFDSETLAISRPANEIAVVTATGVSDWIPLMLDRLEYSRQADPGEPSTTTDAQGDYIFSGLAPGTYTVAEVLPEGWQQTLPGPEARLVDSGSRPLGPSGAFDFNVHQVGAGLTGDGELGAEITLEVGWASISSGLRPELTTCRVAGNEMIIDLYGTVPQIGLPVVWYEYETITVPSLDPGTYSIQATLLEEQDDPLDVFYPTWEATGRMALDAAGRYLVTLGAGQIVEGVDFGNWRECRVVARHVFYNHSAFDTPTAARPELSDDTAIAPDKEALLPGRTATFANYTSYSRGINGIMVDVRGLADADNLGADDFLFQVGNGNDPAAWADAPDPAEITVRPGEGVDRSDRVTIVWRDNAIQKQWLQVTVLANARTGLAQADVFYFGNAVGESGNSTTDAKVNAYDMLGARDNQRNFLDPAAVAFVYDYNRDARVDAYDMLIARDNQTHFLNALRLITAPPGESTNWPILPAVTLRPGGSIAKPPGGDDPAEPAPAALLDAALEQTERQDSGRPAISIRRLDWLYELEQIGTPCRPPAEGSASERAVDELLLRFGCRTRVS